MRAWLLVQYLITLFVAIDPSHTHAATTASLPSYPLAVKNPWLSAWIPGSSTTNVAISSAKFWTGDELTWPILARINGNTYVLFGNPDGLPGNIKAATTNSVSYSSTHTYFAVTAGGVNFNLDFFSPVWPKTADFALQSLPYSYLTVNATSNKSIQVASAIDQTWTAQKGASDLTFVKTGKVGYFQFYNPDEKPYTESSSHDFNGLVGTNMATWGKVIYASSTDGTGASFQCAGANAVFSQFAAHGVLSNSTKNCSPTALAAISHNLGYGSSSATFAIGHEREKSISYLGREFTGYHRTKWPQVQGAVEFFLGNYENALTASRSFDATVRSKTQSVSPQFGSNYADICEASIRQSFGAMELALPANDLSAEPWVFLKEISSDGNMNTVDLIFQSWPIFINLNPKWIILQFVPVLEYLKTGRWPQPYVVHDIGARYPVATGHDNGKDESMPLFETSALLILVYAYEKFTGDTTYTQRYSSLWPGWANYLEKNGLYPAEQIISVDAIKASPNQTALAMQSAIGLKAASKLTGNQAYAAAADSWVKKIYNQGLGLDGSTPADSTHFTYNYGADDGWNVIFTSFSDKLLELSTFPQAAWDLQSKWYLSQIQEAGLAFAGGEKAVNWGLTDWNIMTAAAMSDQVQQKVVSTTHGYMTNGKNYRPFGTKYVVSGPDAGVWIGNLARGTVGTHLAISAIKQGVWSYEIGGVVQDQEQLDYGG